MAKTTTATRTIKTCEVCDERLTAKNFDRKEHPTLCLSCSHIAGIENDHQDGWHTDAINPECPMCTGVEVTPLDSQCLCGQFTTEYGTTTGCGLPTVKGSKFAQGHDAKLKSLAIKAAVAGQTLRYRDGKAGHPVAIVAQFASDALASRVRQGVTNAAARQAK